MNRFPDFGKELQRSFEVHENCYNCAEFYGPGRGVVGCNAWPAAKEFACADYLPLPNVGVNGKLGQEFPPSRMQGRKEPRVHGGAEQAPCQPQGRKQSPADSRPQEKGKAVSDKTKARTCTCGTPLPKGKRLCDGCRITSRRQTKRQYMRTYMEHQRSAAVGSDSHMPFPAAATSSTQASGGDLCASGLWEGGASLDQTSVLTESVP